VIKTPALNPYRPFSERVSHLTEVYQTFVAEYMSMQRLRGMACVAQAIDHGTYQFDLGRGEDAPAFFIIQQLIDGDRLDLYMEKIFPFGKNTSNLKFRGISNSTQYFEWARKITAGLLQIHQKEVIHGDIWPQNIIVNSRGEAVFIDFGQSLFRDLAFDVVGNEAYTHPYCAPERRNPDRKWYVGADIYSLGGVLFYLATGKTPPQPIEDIDELKNKIADAVKQSNPKLYHDNSGVVDVIARCLRYSEYGRTPHAEGVIQDLDTFSFVSVGNHTGSQPNDVNGLIKDLKALEQLSNPLFSGFARHNIRLLWRQIEDMKHGVYDLTGDHELIANGLSQYLSVLQSGDQYLTVTLPSFWHPRNLGINGRFLTMNKLIAQRGVIVRRIFIITSDDERNDPYLKKIIKAHQKIMKELTEVKVQTTEWKLETGGFYIGFKKVDRGERDLLIREGKHFGLWLKQGQGMLISPVYDESGKIVTIRFRASPDRAVKLKDYFAILLEQSKPLAWYGK
jgi:serine/threonine protein kinase